VTNGGAPAVEPFGDQILVRAPDGRFRIVAGTGEAGFSGDGGPAVRAELSSVSDLVIAPNGTLYVADAGRVRTIAPNGVIRTIVGNGQPARWVRNGTLALSAALRHQEMP
jgi:serine/threonine-protein kinase